ncbi:twin-arginine translocation signal domain-containing protein [Salmonella enterica]|nr:hypothetical protein [Salmonella enterica subsp. enterica]EBO9947364.1 twin-arginine translocation signal domain-containing protein [Salmonella enterica]
MSNETGHLNRRSFLKGIVALGAVAALPGGLLTSRCALAQPPLGRQSFLHGSETLRVHRQINNGAACGEFGDFALRGEK